MTRRDLAPAVIGAVQIAGQLLGSTTLPGACIYEAVTVAWWCWMVAARQWGFLPINVGALIVSTWTLWNLIR